MRRMAPASEPFTPKCCSALIVRISTTGEVVAVQRLKFQLCADSCDQVAHVARFIATRLSRTTCRPGRRRSTNGRANPGDDSGGRDRAPTSPVVTQPSRITYFEFTVAPNRPRYSEPRSR